MRGCYRASSRLCIGGLVRLEADVRGTCALPLALEVERTAGEEINPGCHRETDQHGDIGAAERTGHRPGVDRGTEERDHDEEADQVGGEAAPVPAAVQAGGV